MCVGGRFYHHERLQNEQIQNLYKEIAELEDTVRKVNEELYLLKEKSNQENIKWNDKGYNYLAIGNSITIHGIVEYWWDDDRGMAASCDESDYVHLVKSYLEANGKSVTMHAKNLSSWETNAEDRAEFREVLDNYLTDDINLITIQLGENAYNLNTWEKDFEELILYIKKVCPKAQILVIGNFWSNGNCDSDKEQAAKAQGVEYVSLEGIEDNDIYYAKLGTRVEGKNGDMHTIEHDGVAKHPGDKGMSAIAERIISCINLSN